MQTYDIVYETCPWHTRVALFNGQGKLLSLKFEDVDDVYIEGTVILGRVRTLMPSLNAAFVDIGDTQDGFLPLQKLPKDMRNLHEGQAIMVRIDRPKGAEKGAKLNGRVLHDMPEGDVQIPSIVEHAAPVLSRILLEAGVHPVNVWVVDGRFSGNVLKHVSEERVFEMDKHEDVDFLELLDEQVERLGIADYQIGGGAHLTIEATKALTSIDVDSGGYITKDHENMFLKINMLAAEEVARLCKLLNIGGNIIVDFITMKPKENRRLVRTHVKEAFAQIDFKRVEILEMSRFGLLEISREREGEALLTLIKKPIFVAGEVLLHLWRLKPGQQGVSVEVSSEVADIIKQRLTAHASMAYLGCAVEVFVNPDFRTDQYQVHA